MSDHNDHTQSGALPSVPLEPVVQFSDTFKGLPLRKVEFLCGQGGTVVKVVIQDKHGNIATVDEFAKVDWKMKTQNPDVCPKCGYDTSFRKTLCFACGAWLIDPLAELNPAADRRATAQEGTHE